MQVQLQKTRMLASHFTFYNDLSKFCLVDCTKLSSFEKKNSNRLKEISLQVEHVLQKE